MAFKVIPLNKGHVQPRPPNRRKIKQIKFRDFTSNINLLQRVEKKVHTNKNKLKMF